MIGPENYDGLNGSHEPTNEPLVCEICGDVLHNVTQGIGSCWTCKELVTAVELSEWSRSIETILESPSHPESKLALLNFGREF